MGQAIAFHPVTSKAGHPSVQLELNVETSTTTVGQVLTEQGLTHAAEGRHQPPLEAGSEVIGLGEMTQHKHRLIEPCIPKVNPLLECCDTKACGSTTDRGFGHSFCSVAITVRLDDSHQIAVRTKVAFEGAGIRFDR